MISRSVKLKANLTTSVEKLDLNHQDCFILVIIAIIYHNCKQQQFFVRVDLYIVSQRNNFKNESTPFIYHLPKNDIFATGTTL